MSSRARCESESVGHERCDCVGILRKLIMQSARMIRHNRADNRVLKCEEASIDEQSLAIQVAEASQPAGLTALRRPWRPTVPHMWVHSGSRSPLSLPGHRTFNRQEAHLPCCGSAAPLLPPTSAPPPMEQMQQILRRDESHSAAEDRTVSVIYNCSSRFRYAGVFMN